MMDGGGIFQWISDMAARTESLFTSFIWRKNKFFLVLNCVAVISLITFSRRWSYAYVYAYVREYDFKGQEYFILAWLAIFYAQTLFVRFFIRKRAEPERPRANLFLFFILTMTSLIILALLCMIGSFHEPILIMLLIGSCIVLYLSESFAIISAIGSLLLSTLLMLYLHFYILMWGGEGQDET